MFKKIILISLIIFSLGTVGVRGQEAPYKFDFGGAIGMSGYLEDANESNVFKHPGFTVDVAARYIYDSRWAFKAMLSTMGISGNTADMSNVLPGGAQYDFKSQVIDLGARAEFNFFPYGIGETYKRLKRWSPYLTLGLGVSLAVCDGSTAVAPTIPMGAGVKFKLKERLNLAVEWTMNKVLGDHIDGKQLSDLTQIKSSFLKNNDWYSRITVGISYEFGKRCETCHYVD